MATSATSPSPANSSKSEEFGSLNSLKYAVCKITDQDGRAKGTGFLVGPNLLMTCNHVIPDKQTAEKCTAYFYERTETDQGVGCSQFLLKGTRVDFSPEEFFEFSPQKKKLVGTREVPDLADKNHLDYTITALKINFKLQELSATFSLLESSQDEHSTIAYVFHHPNVPDAATGLEGLFRAGPGNLNAGNRSDCEIHYQTPTAPGSSGGAVLDPQGRLIALHYWGGIKDCPHCKEEDPDCKGKKPTKTTYCNAGVLTSKIVEDLKARGKLELLRSYVKTTKPVVFAGHPQILYLPEPPKDFTGRGNELDKLHQACQQNNKVSIYGLGGSGKTTLALKYAEEHQKEYRWIHFISSTSFELATQGLTQLADALNVPEGKSEGRLAMLKVQLENRKEPFLLIFDGIDQIKTLDALKKYLPDRGHTLLLFTSRLKEQVSKLNFILVPLGVFKVDANAGINEGKDFLIKAVNIDKEIGEEIDKDEIQAALLAEKLGQLPLALTHTAAFIRNTPGYTFSKYLEEFDKEGVALFEDENLDLELEEKTILTTWKKSIEAISTHHNCPLAQDVLAFLSVLGHAPVPIDMIEKWFQKAHGDLPKRKLENALRHLQNYSLLESTSKTCSLHLLVQKVVNYQLSPYEKQQMNLDALHIGAILCEGLDPKEVQVRKGLHFLIPHLEALAASNKNAPEANYSDLRQILNTLWNYHYYEGKSAASEKIARELLRIIQKEDDKSLENSAALDKLGLSLSAMGKYQEALEDLQNALEIRRKALGEEHPDTATSWNNAGLALGFLGRYQEALEHLQKAFGIRRKVLGEEHSDTAISWGNVGAILGMLERYQEALEHYKKNLEILETLKKTSWDEDPDLARSWNNVGMILGALGKHEGALEYLQKALEIRRTALGEERPDTASSWSNTGQALVALGRYQEALEYYKRTLEISKKTLREEHPLVAISWNTVGVTLGELGQYQEALEHLQEALRITRKVLGEEHPDTATSWDNVGMILGELGQHQEALEHLQKALEIRRKILEGEHPDLATSWDNVGMILGELGKCQEALEHLQKALEIRRTALGEEHPDTATTWSNIGNALMELGRYQEALEYHKRTLEVSKKTLGEEHPLVVISWNNAGITLGELGQCQEALEHLKEALRIRRKVLGEEHPDTASSWNNVGATLGALGKHQEALFCLQNAVKISEASLGTFHPDTLIRYQNLAGCLAALRRREEALFYQQKVLMGMLMRHLHNQRIPVDASSEESLLPFLSALMTDQKKNSNSESQNKEQNPEQLHDSLTVENQEEQASSSSFVSSSPPLSQASSSAFFQRTSPLFQDILEELLQIETQLRSRGPFQELPNIPHLFERLDQLESDGASLTPEEKEQIETSVTCIRALALTKQEEAFAGPSCSNYPLNPFPKNLEQGEK